MAKAKQQIQPIHREEDGTNGNGLVPVNLDQPLVNEAARVFLDEVKGPRQAPTKVPLIGIDHQSAKFILPSGELTDYVSGYPVYYYQTRRFYKKPPTQGQSGGPPDCYSTDLVQPSISARDAQSAKCASCPMSAWGTARDGKGQACATQTWLFLLNPDFGSPPLAVLVAPPSSINALLGSRFKSGYLGRAQAKYGVYEIVWTQFGLQQLGGGVTYCILDPQMGDAAKDPGLIKKIAATRNQFLDLMDGMRESVPEVTSEDV